MGKEVVDHGKKPLLYPLLPFGANANLCMKVTRSPKKEYINVNRNDPLLCLGCC